MENHMIDLPDIVSRQNLEFYWTYKDEEGKVNALVARYRESKSNAKKWFHQYGLSKDGQWVEGAPTPLPLYGIETLPKNHYEGKVYIFEGEKCTTAAHSLGLPALTSMMGSNQAQDADWAILARYRHIKEFVLIPDYDKPGRKYIETVFREIQKACPLTRISVCQLPTKNKADDLVEWIQSNASCTLQWNGFGPIEKTNVEHLQNTFLEYVYSNLIDAATYFEEISDEGVIFENEPTPIQEALSDVLPCPINTLPIEIINWIVGYAEQMQVSVDYLVAPFLVYTGSLIGRKRGLQVRPGTNWIEHPNLWGMLVGRPAMMKSPAMNAVIGPLTTLADRAIKKYELEFKQHTKNLDAWKIRRKAYEEVYKKDLKESIRNSNANNPPTQVVLKEEEMPEEPQKKRYKAQDATIEKLAEILMHNPQGLLIFRDELSGWLNSFKKPGRESDRQFYLEGWTGRESSDIDRIGRGSKHIPANCLSIFGSIQPGPLSHYVRAAVQDGVSDDGFLQRFQVVVWPDHKDAWELVSDISIADLEIPVYNIFYFLDSLKFDEKGAPIILPFEKDAQELFDQWQSVLEKRIRSGILPSHLEAHLAKYKKLLAGLCLIFEHLKQAIEGTYPQAIAIHTVEVSLQWVEYFESHTVRMYGNGANAVLKAAKDLIKHLQQGDILEPFTARDVYCGKHWAGLATVHQVEEVLEFLIEKHYLACRLIRTGGRSTNKYWVNPKIFKEST